MPEKTSTAHPEVQKAEAPKAPPAASAMRAAESTDPVVHDLMAKRFTYEQHVTNVDADVAAMQEQKKAALAKIDELDDQLADLGYK
jgi:hypothetical protein